MKKIILLSFIVGMSLYSQYCLGCECRPARGKNWKTSRVLEEIEQSQYVFMGEVVSSTDTTYKIKVLEVFKGTIPFDTILGKNNLSSSCSKNIREGLWVFYTHLNKEKIIPVMSACNFSESLTDPDFVYIPPLPGTKMDSLQIEEYVEAQQKDQLPLHLKSWINEYALLVAYKNKIINKEPVQVNKHNIINYTALALAIIALLVAILKNNKGQQNLKHT